MSDSILVNVNLTTNPITVEMNVTESVVTVNFQTARDAYQLAVAEGYVGTRPQWLESLNGDDGREIELQTSATHVQWRYQGTVGWTDLIALTAITGAPGQDGADSTVPGPDGEDGREVEFQSSGGYIQWRYVGEASWTNLVALSAITGPAGSDANVTTANVGTALAAAASKTPPVDDDSIMILDSAASNAPKLLSFANLWAWIVGKITLTHGETINSTTPRTRTTLNAFANDEDLKKQLEANSTYYFEFTIHSKNSVGPANFGTLLKLYYGGTLNAANYEVGAHGTAPNVNTYMRFPVVTAGAVSEQMASYIGSVMRVYGVITTGTAGLFAIQTANGRDTSTMTRIAGTLLIRKL